MAWRSCIQKIRDSRLNSRSRLSHLHEVVSLKRLPQQGRLNSEFGSSLSQSVEQFLASNTLPLETAIFQAILNLVFGYACLLSQRDDLRLVVTGVGLHNLDDSLHYTHRRMLPWSACVKCKIDQRHRRCAYFQQGSYECGAAYPSPKKMARPTEMSRAKPNESVSLWESSML
jgi:hypothetical protein